MSKYAEHIITDIFKSERIGEYITLISPYEKRQEFSDCYHRLIGKLYDAFKKIEDQCLDLQYDYEDLKLSTNKELENYRKVVDLIKEIES